MLQQEEPGDYVIATNESHSVREFAEKAFDILNLDIQEYIKPDKRFLRPLDVNYLRGDYSKAEKAFGWKPRVKFDELVELMVKEDLNRWERWQNGELFPWDAPNYSNETNIITGSLNA